MADLLDHPTKVRPGEELDLSKLEPFLRSHFPTELGPLSLRPRGCWPLLLRRRVLPWRSLLPDGTRSRRNPSQRSAVRNGFSFGKSATAERVLRGKSGSAPQP